MARAALIVRPAGPLLVGLLATLPTTVRSQDFEVTPVVGFRYGGASTNTTSQATFEPGGGFELADAGSFGIHLGYGVGGGELELLYARQNTRVQSKDPHPSLPDPRHVCRRPPAG